MYVFALFYENCSIKESRLNAKIGSFTDIFKKKLRKTVQKKVKTCETKDFLCIETQKPLCTNSFTKVLNCMIPGWWIAYLFIHSKHNYYSFLKSFYLNCKMNRCKETRYMETPVHLFVKLVYSAKNWNKWNMFPNKIRKQAETIQEIINETSPH